MQRVQYTGTNYEEVKALCGNKVLATSQHGMKTEQIARAGKGRVRLLM